MASFCFFPCGVVKVRRRCCLDTCLSSSGKLTALLALRGARVWVHAQAGTKGLFVRLGVLTFAVPSSPPQVP